MCIVRRVYVCVYIVYMVFCMFNDGAGGLFCGVVGLKMAPVDRGLANQHYGNEPISALGIEPISD